MTNITSLLDDGRVRDIDLSCYSESWIFIVWFRAFSDFSFCRCWHVIQGSITLFTMAQDLGLEYRLMRILALEGLDLHD